ncbi:MAG: 16S rRNA (guanine(527)-N(7))-methyltransferase RsmG [Deltaproteobacteria bacterium]|nr:16S rRNA (guanine(527)-N(7))-methyltransferase RsmG [Deltaproteobacteria bacterium]
MPHNPLSLLSDYAADFGILLPQGHIEQFDTYLRELKAWNEKFNLTAIKDDEGIVIKHFLDSLTPLKFVKPGSSLLDIGSGAGFPGIPLKMAEPSLNVTLLDSVNKKVTFMRHMIESLELTGIEAIHARAEELAKTKKGSFDVVISRALAGLSDFVKIGEPFLKPEGILIAMKGSRADEEVKEAAKIIEKRRMRVRGIERFSLPSGAGDRVIVILERYA